MPTQSARESKLEFFCARLVSPFNNNAGTMAIRKRLSKSRFYVRYEDGDLNAPDRTGSRVVLKERGNGSRIAKQSNFPTKPGMI